MILGLLYDDDLENDEFETSFISIMRQFLAIPKKDKEYWRLNNILQTLIQCGDQAKKKKLIIDRSNYMNVVSKSTIKLLKFPMEPNSYPYKVI